MVVNNYDCLIKNKEINIVLLKKGQVIIDEKVCKNFLDE